MTERYFEREGGRATAFWAATVVGNTVHLRRGDAGTLGIRDKKSFASAAQANAFVADSVKKKLAEGFIELTGDAVYFDGTGKKPMHKREPLDANDVYLGGYNFPQETIDLSPIARLPKVKELDVSGHKLKAIDLAPLVKARALTSVSISESGLKQLAAKDLAPLARCAKLECVALTHVPKIDLTGLRGSKSIRRLVLINSYFKSIDLAPLADVKNLAELYMHQAEKLRAVDVSPLAKLTKLKRITVDKGCTVVGADLVKAKVEFRD